MIVWCISFVSILFPSFIVYYYVFCEINFVKEEGNKLIVMKNASPGPVMVPGDWLSVNKLVSIVL